MATENRGMKLALTKPKRRNAHDDGAPLNNLAVEERIRQRAYEIYEQQGHQEGRHLEHWLQAEQELLGGPPSK
jgi:hypothetical protein